MIQWPLCVDKDGYGVGKRAFEYKYIVVVRYCYIYGKCMFFLFALRFMYNLLQIFLYIYASYFIFLNMPAY